MTTANDLLAMALDHHRAGRLAEAEALYARVLQELPDEKATLGLLGVLRYQQGRHAEAEPLLRRQVELEPANPDALNNLAVVLRGQGRHGEAVPVLRQALALRPDYGDGWYNLGNAHRSQSHLAEALQAYAQAVRLSPNNANAHNNMGLTLLDLGRTEEAAARFLEAHRVAPHLPESAYNLGDALKRLGRLVEARGWLERALAIRPDYAEAHFQMANVIGKLGDTPGSEACLRRAVECKPSLSEAWFNLGNLLLELGQTAEGFACLEKAIHHKPGFTDPHTNLVFMTQCMPDKTIEDVLAVHKWWDELHGRPLAGRLPALPRPTEPGRRLRVGYVSADFGRHPIGYFLLPVMPHHDRTRFEIFCYSQRAEHDEFTRRFQETTDHWIDIRGMDDEALARRIRADGIHILVDLSGHTGGNRLKAFAMKAAPVQATWAGYVGTTGLSAMDWLIGDRFETPEGTDHLHVEKVWRMPHGYVAYLPPEDAPPVGPLPALGNGFVTFGSFNNISKLNPRVIALWSRVLREVPESRLLLRYKKMDLPEQRARFEPQFRAHGIDPARVEFMGAGGHADFMATYNRVDIGLDPFPFSGGLTTLESLYMGVPVITLGGDRFSARHAKSHISNAGHPELVVEGEDAYVALAKALAADHGRLEHYRRTLRDDLLASPLCDGPGFARDLETAFREMWRQACEG